MAHEQVKIFDTTLRDGEQAAGAGMTTPEKLEIARQLDRLGVDVIEAGFAASSPGDFEAVSTVARDVRRPIIASLARAHPNDVDQAWNALKGAESPRITRVSFQLRHSPDASAAEEPGRSHGHGGEHGRKGEGVLR